MSKADKLPQLTMIHTISRLICFLSAFWLIDTNEEELQASLGLSEPELWIKDTEK